MAKTIKIRAKVKNGETTVKALITHPMHTGLMKDSKTGEIIPAHFIKEVACVWKEQTVMTAYWSGGVSKNPYLSFKFVGAASGDELALTWVDNKGDSDSQTTKVR